MFILTLPFIVVSNSYFALLWMMTALYDTTAHVKETRLFEAEGCLEANDESALARQLARRLHRHRLGLFCSCSVPVLFLFLFCSVLRFQNSTVTGTDSKSLEQEQNRNRTGQAGTGGEETNRSLSGHVWGTGGGGESESDSLTEFGTDNDRGYNEDGSFVRVHAGKI
uniref:Uncharacterized protein n=1 Tax=Globodera rostochiensis TaxID=31243 RepID=A0A914H9N2_GLORO